MIKTIAQLDPKRAAGMLARAALSLGYRDTPSDTVAQDGNFRASLLDEIRSQLGIPGDDQSPEAIEKIAEVLDDESDRLLAPPNTDAALNRMAQRGDLPSDLFEINIIPNIADVYGKHFDLEKEIIERTIKDPDAEQHFGHEPKPFEPVLISLFLKNFRTRWPLKDFVMLVAGQRDGFKLHVHQAWRVYPSRVKLAGAEKPVDWLKRFADAYGADVEMGGKIGHFFLFSNDPGPREVKFTNEEKKRAYELVHPSQ